MTAKTGERPTPLSVACRSLATGMTLVRVTPALSTIVPASIRRPAPASWSAATSAPLSSIAATIRRDPPAVGGVPVSLGGGARQPDRAGRHIAGHHGPGHLSNGLLRR